MEANDFLTKIKANGNEKDLNNLAEIYSDYKKILTKLPLKDKGSFSLNVLCLLCRNLDKAPSWRDTIDAKDLLTLTIDCIRETRGMNRPEQVKTLACIYHIHRYVVRKNTPLPPELILKLSFMAFEAESKNLLKEYNKTYWNIIADRLCYLEKLKGKAVHKLLPKLTEDILKTLDIYDTVALTANVLVFLVKKLHFIFSESYSSQLNVLYADIFKKLSSKSDLSAFKSLKENEITDLYVKILDCLYVVAENSSKSCFKDSALGVCVRSAISLLGHRSDMFHCLQTFFLNSFCDVFENKTTHIDAVFKNLTVSCEITDKLGYKTVLVQTYPYLNQFLRLFIEYSINKSIKSNFTEEIQVNCLNFMLKILHELKTCQQLVKCENCKVQTGLHDALRLSFLTKDFITISLNNNTEITTLIPVYKTLIAKQYEIMSDLKKLGCVNYVKCYRKLQTNTHNTAILLNKNQKYEFSINLFEIYIKNELCLSSNEFEHSNVARALYNKSICELDFKSHEQALLDAYMSLVFSKDLSSEKYMSLVMDIKAKALKIYDDEDDDKTSDELQLVSVIEACKMVMEKRVYGDLRPFFKDVKFSALLKHEFSMYAKLWPSIVPIAGVWQSLDSLLNGRREKWMTVEDPDTIFWALLEVISFTPSAVRTIHSDYYKNIVRGLLKHLDSMPEPLSTDIRVVQTTLLFLQAEYDMADASLKYGWKATEPTTDPDLFQALRTLSQEHDAIQKAIQAVEIWTELADVIQTVTRRSCLLPALQLAEIFVQHFLHYSRIAHGLQLAHVCCAVANYIDEKALHVRLAGVLLLQLSHPAPVLQQLLLEAAQHCAGLGDQDQETVLMFMCEAAIYYTKTQSMGTAAKLVQLAQTRILAAYEKHPDINLDLALGRLLEAQAALCAGTGLSALSEGNGIQRHYLTVANHAAAWLPRRARCGRSRVSLSSCSLACCGLARALRQLRRGRGAGGAGLAAAAAAQQARLYHGIVDVYRMDDAQVKIDNRLKYILGLPATNERPATALEPKVPMFAPKQDFETMLESQAFKSQISPTRKYVSIPGFNVPEFFSHSECSCYACVDPNYAIISYMTSGLEASMYFRANELEIAENYFRGVLNTFGYFDKHLKAVLKSYTDLDFEKYIVDHTKRHFENQFKKVKLEILIEAAFFELKNLNFDAADDHIVTLHELSQDMTEQDGYLKNEVMNLMIASAKIRNVVKKQEFDLETEFENLKLSPKVKTEAKTPESKANIPQISAKKVKDEDVPKRRKVIKLNLDEHSADEKEEKPKPKTKKQSEFKIPVPVTAKPVLETLTPRTTRKPNITVTDTTKTPKPEKNENVEFFTPQSTPEQFFTPLTKIKTYSKSLRKGIVKNLEEEFSTPQAGLEKENSGLLSVPSRSTRKVEKDRALRRATSPGKLAESKTRPRRLRQLKLNDD